MSKIKICGLKRKEDIEYVNELMPDYIGFIFAEKRPKRYIPPSEAMRLKEMLDNKIQAVGVTVNEPIDKLKEIADMDVVDILQLHGQESEDYIREVRKFWQKPIIKAFKISNKNDIEAALKSSADYILLDNGIGGTGQTFDWSILSEINRPFFLAGGINKENVREAIKQINPFCIDVSSGVEKDGIKDYNMIREFLEQARK